MKVFLVDTALMPNTTARPGPFLHPKGQIYPTFGNAILTTPGLEYFSYLVKKAEQTSYFSNPNLKGTLFAPNHKAIQVRSLTDDVHHASITYLLHDSAWF